MDESECRRKKSAFPNILLFFRTTMLNMFHRTVGRKVGIKLLFTFKNQKTLPLPLINILIYISKLISHFLYKGINVVFALTFTHIKQLKSYFIFHLLSFLQHSFIFISFIFSAQPNKPLMSVGNNNETILVKKIKCNSLFW